MILERSCSEEGLPPSWDVRRTAKVPLGEVTGAIVAHLGWEDVVILTGGARDGEVASRVRVYMQLL